MQGFFIRSKIISIMNKNINVNGKIFISLKPLKEKKMREV